MGALARFGQERRRIPVFCLLLAPCTPLGVVELLDRYQVPVAGTESMQGLNGDGWGTTLTRAEQLAHKEYAKNLGPGLNAAYEDDREREMAMFRKEGGFGFL